MSDGPTTDRAQRQQAVATGARETAVEQVSPRSDPGGGVVEGTPRSRQIDRRREIAGEIEVDDRGVAVRDTRGGMDAFLRSSGAAQFGARLREQFASAADFVRERDVAPNVDADAISAAPVVAPGRRDDVADRAESQAAGDAQFVEPADLDADVSERGVTDIGIPESRRDDVAARARQGLASDDPFAQPGDFSADVSETGIESAGLTDQGARRRASRQFEAETPLSEVDPTADIEPAGDGGLALDTGAQRRVAAREFESQSDVFGDGELDPASDIRATGSGFGLAREEAREVAAADLSEQLDTNVSPSAIDLEARDGGGFEAIFGGGR